VRAIPEPEPSARFHLVQPGSFNDAQEVGDKFRQGHSVLMNLQGSDRELARRLVDFASGLAYGLGGSMQPVAEHVFLITPPGVQVSAEERRRFLEERGFFNQA
jgi:cell division inhibitor SepF